MTPHEWLIAEYQRKSTMLAMYPLTEYNEEFDLLIHSIDIQPLMILLDDHPEHCECEEAHSE